LNAAGDSKADAVDGGIPWAEICRFGLSRLRLDPAHFWRLTPREIALMADTAVPARDVPTRDGLGALMQHFPDNDTTKDEQDGWPQ
jgi:uncharacterized phage protein (TIGR02216 family)